MLHFSTLLFAFSVAGFATAAPPQLNKRIDQQTIASTEKWQTACVAAKGGSQCNEVAVSNAATLLAAAGPCDQQDGADKMMDLSKTLNSPDMIKFAQIFAQQPRNSPTAQSVPYCQKAPRNAELNGLFQCQFQGDNPKVFVGGIAVGGPGTIPFGQNAPLSPPGSCPAHTSGPITDGTQLSDLTTSPGNAGVAGKGNGTGNGTTQNTSSASGPANATDTTQGTSGTSSASGSDNATDTTQDASDNSSASGSDDATDTTQDASDSSSASGSASATQPTPSSVPSATNKSLPTPKVVAPNFKQQNGQTDQ